MPFLVAFFMHSACNTEEDVKPANSANLLGIPALRGRHGVASASPAPRDVTKFEFEFDNVRTSNVFNRFEIRRMFEALCC